MSHAILLGTAMLFAAGSHAMAQALSITSANASYSEDFNDYLGTSSTINGAEGWSLSGASNYRGRATGSSNTGGFYAYGSGSDYSLGALRSSSNNYTYTASFTNNTGLTITGLTIGWKYEQWRYANTSGWDVTGNGGLSGNSTLNGKDFVGSASGSSGSSTPTTTTIIPFAVSSLSIANGGAFGMSWVTTDQGSSDNGVAIDDFTMEITSMALGSASTSVTSLAYGSGVTISGSTSASTLTANIGTSQTFAGKLQNNGANALALTKTGSGNLTLTGANTHTGATSVNAGTLTIGSATTLQSATGTLTVNGGTLTSTVSSATLGGNLTLTTGTLSANGLNAGAFSLANGADFSMSGGLWTVNLGTSFDSITGGALSVFSITGGEMALLLGAGFDYNSSYQLFSGFGSGSVTSLLISGYDTDLYVASLSDSGVLTFAPTAVPEPHEYALGITAILLMVVALRRHRLRSA